MPVERPHPTSAARLVGAIVLGLVLSLVVVPAAAGGTTASVTQVGESARTAAVAKPRKPEKPRWVPPTGALLNNPANIRERRVILSRVIRAINATAKGETIRVVTWNLDDRPIVSALLNARARGVRVRVVASAIVLNANWDRLKRGLDRNTKDESFARLCRGGCRSRAKIIHSKLYLFSRVHKAHNISMFGSANLTTPAGNRQWNDMVTIRNRPMYDYFVKTFEQYARDKVLKNPYDTFRHKRVKATLFPAYDRNPMAAALTKVRCTGATGGAGNARGRTTIRIAIAGWFDAYGATIALQLRKLWNRGCDIKIVTTLAGGGINRVMKDASGRGSVPIREVTLDRNLDGIPERYLHMKAIAISGVYGRNRSASVLFTGSPNWSTRAQRSDEVWIRLVERPGMVDAYSRHVDRLYVSPWAHDKMATSERFRQLTASPQFRRAALPSWFELD